MKRSKPAQSDYQKVLDTWNSCKETGRWKTHRNLMPDIIEAIDYNVKKGWKIDDICQAIKNFALIVQGKDYKWTYDKWSLTQFLTRGRKENDLRWTWFHPNNFNPKDWLTDSAKKKQQGKLVTYEGLPRSKNREEYEKNMAKFLENSKVD